MVTQGGTGGVRLGWITTAARGLLVVREARNFGERAIGVPFTRAAVEEHVPGAAGHIDWDRWEFGLPVRAAADGCSLQWEVAPEVGRRGDVTYLGHALLSNGFRGNAYYGGCESNTLRWRRSTASDALHGYTAVDALLHGYALRSMVERLPPGRVYSLLTQQRLEAGDASCSPLGDYLTCLAVEHAIARHFGDSVPIFRGGATATDCVSTWWEAQTQVGEVTPADVRRALVREPKHVVFVRRTGSGFVPAWSSLRDYDESRKALGLLAADSPYLVRNGGGYGWPAQTPEHKEGHGSCKS